MLSVRKVQLTPHKFIDIQKQMETIPVTISINRVAMLVHSVPSGLQSKVWNNMYDGQLPNRVIVVMLVTR